MIQSKLAIILSKTHHQFQRKSATIQEIQGLSSTPTMEESEELEEAVPETETAPSGADSGGATATAAISAAEPPNLT